MTSDTGTATTLQGRFSARGVPLDVATARTVGRADIARAVIAVVAHLEIDTPEGVAGWPKETDGTVALESQLALDVLNEFTGHLGKVPLDLAAIPHERWTSVGGLTAVIVDAYAAYEEGSR